jgi:hypothetical protein
MVLLESLLESNIALYMQHVEGIRSVKILLFTNLFSVVNRETLQYTMLSGPLDTSMRILSSLPWACKEHVSVLLVE